MESKKDNDKHKQNPAAEAPGGEDLGTEEEGEQFPHENYQTAGTRGPSSGGGAGQPTKGADGGGGRGGHNN